MSFLRHRVPLATALGIWGWALASGLAVLAVLVAWRAGGARELPVPPPRPEAGSEGPPARWSSARPDGYEIAVRLVDAMKDARIDGAFAPADRVLAAHARKAAPGYVPLPPDAARWVSTIALDATGPRFEQREAILAPAPSTLSFRISVPRGARLTFAEGALGAVRDAIAFTVTVVDARGVSYEAHRDRVPAAQARRWSEHTVDLGAFVGQTVELRLSTEAPSPDAGAAAVGVWGNPVILAHTQPRVPYNVLWIAVDAPRPVLPDAPGLMPALDELASRGVLFARAYSAGAWSRPATLAMLAGAHASDVGVDPRSAVVTPASASRIHASEPPLLPLLLRRHGVTSAAFANGDLMVGYAPGGLDMGFDRAAHLGDGERGVLDVTSAAARFVRAHADTRFFAFVGYDAAARPRWDAAESKKMDEAIGGLLRALDESGARERTIVVVTSDHSELLAKPRPALVVAPGLLPAGRVEGRVRAIDLAPTLVELLGLEARPRMTGRSLVGVAFGEKEAEERVVVTEGRGARAILHGRHRFVVRERGGGVSEELYDVVDDPAERQNLGPQQPARVAEMRARLAAAVANVPVAGAGPTQGALPPSEEGAVLRLRFAGGGRPRRVSGALVVGDARTRAERLQVTPVALGPEAFKLLEGRRVELSFTTQADSAVGFDVVVEPPVAPFAWELFLDERPFPADLVFAGPYGLAAPSLRTGMTSDASRLMAESPRLPPIDPQRDAGLFLARERRGREAGRPLAPDGASSDVVRLLREAYVEGSGAR